MNIDREWYEGDRVYVRDSDRLHIPGEPRNHPRDHGVGTIVEVGAATVQVRTRFGRHQFLKRDVLPA